MKKSDIPVSTYGGVVIHNNEPKDNSEPRYTEQAGTRSENGKYTARSHKFTGGKFSVKPQG